MYGSLPRLFLWLTVISWRADFEVGRTLAHRCDLDWAGGRVSISRLPAAYVGGGNRILAGGFYVIAAFCTRPQEESRGELVWCGEYFRHGAALGLHAAPNRFALARRRLACRI